MAGNKVEVLIEARDNASRVFEDASKRFGMSARSMKIAGGIMVAAGAAIGAGLFSAAKAAAEEEAGVIRLATSMKNAGLSYDANRESLEAIIDATQQKTAVADEEQRESLANLVTVTGNLNEALEVNAIAMDLARWKNIDLSTASDILIRVMAGNMGTLSRYGIVIGEGATATEALAEIQRMAAGQAEAFGESTAGQQQLLMNNIGDLKQSIGGFIAAGLKPVVEWFSKVVQWLKDLPEPVKKVIAIIGVAGAGGLTLVGGFALLLGFLPKIISGFKALQAVMIKVNISAVTLVATLGLLLVGVGMIVWALWQLSRQHEDAARAAEENARAEKFLADQIDLNRRLAEEHAKAIEGLDNELAECLKEVEAMGRALTEEEKGYMNTALAAKEAGLSIDEFAESQRQAADATAAHHRELTSLMGAFAQGSRALAGLFPGGMTEAEWALWKGELTQLAGFQRTAKGMEGYQFGGVVPQTGPAFLHKGETVLPANTIIQVDNYLDSELISTRVIEVVGNRARHQGVM